MTDRAVWVTGLGAVSAAGLGAAALGEMLIEGRTGVRPLPELDCVPVGQAVTPPRNQASRHLDRSARFFLAAGEEAWHDAGLDDIRAAYEQAKTKYDPDLVSHLGDEARAHFQTKAESVERAYQMLSDVRR